MEKPSQITRQWAMLRRISRSPHGVSIDDLSKELHVSSRTIQRDLSSMKHAGVGIDEEQEPSSGKKYLSFVFPSDDKAVPLTYDEAVALYIGRQFLEPMMGSFLWEAVNSGLEKIRSALGTRALFFYDRLASKALQTRVGWSNYNSKSQYLDEIIKGLEDSLCVNIQYQSQDSPKPEIYAIDPYHILMHKGSIYIIGFSHKAKAIRHWKLDRVEAAISLNTAFQKPADFDIGKYMEGSFGVIHFPTEKLQKVKIQFDESVARYVSEHIWSNSQKLTKQPDGSVVLELQLNNTVEVKNWILSFGPHAKVLKPSTLKDEIVANLQAALKQYEQ